MWDKYKVIIVILILSSISFVDSISAEVFAPYDSTVFHEKGCAELSSNERLMKFPSIQSALNSGASPCGTCINQSSSNTNSYQSPKNTYGDTNSSMERENDWGAIIVWSIYALCTILPFIGVFYLGWLIVGALKRKEDKPKVKKKYHWAVRLVITLIVMIIGFVLLVIIADKFT